jgi:hypothetical protein
VCRGHRGPARTVGLRHAAKLPANAFPTVAPLAQHRCGRCTVCAESSALRRPCRHGGWAFSNTLTTLLTVYIAPYCLLLPPRQLPSARAGHHHAPERPELCPWPEGGEKPSPPCKLWWPANVRPKSGEHHHVPQLPADLARDRPGRGAAAVCAQSLFQRGASDGESGAACVSRESAGRGPPPCASYRCYRCG